MLLKGSATIMNRIKNLREKKEISQEQLAKILGVNLRTLQRWESGETSIRTKNATRIANFFEVPVGYLLGYSSIPPLLEKQLSEQEKEELRKNPQLANEMSDLAWQKYTVKMNAIENKKHKPASITEIQNRLNSRYGTNVHGDSAFLAFSVGAGDHDYEFLRWFDGLLDIDSIDGTNTADLLYKYIILDDDSKRIITELIEKLPQIKADSILVTNHNDDETN